MFALGRMEIRSSYLFTIVIRGRCADFQGVIFSIRISIKIYGYSRMMRFDISHDINGRKIMDVYLWGMFLPGKINITIYLWKVRIDGWKLGSPPSVPFASFENFQLSGYIYIYSSCVANTASARIKSRRIYKRQKASLPPSPSAPSFRLLRKPQSKLAHRELRRFFLKSFPRSSTERSGGWEGEGDGLIHVEFHDHEFFFPSSREKEKYRFSRS